MLLQSILDQGCKIASGWPFIIYVIGTAALCTLAFGFVQLRYFVKAWQLMLAPAAPKQAGEKHGDMTPIQAFINTLNTSIGNGTIAGTAAAVFAGGPGAVLWIMIIGILLMAIRYAEVYLSIYFSERRVKNEVAVGPMLYLRALPAGKVIALTYAFICVLFGLIVGNAMQANSIRLSLETTWGIAPIVTACVLFGFIFYAVIGGASRIVSLSEKIVPLKLIVFSFSALALLVYHYQTIISSLHLMVQSAFSPLALAGGAVGFTVQQALNAGIQRSVTATEAGLGVAAIFFGDTGSKQPVKDSIVSMLSVFVSALVCFVVGLVIVASGVWSTGLTSTELTIAAYKTLFGAYGGWMVSFLSIAFGVGVMVSFSYITKEAWIAVTGGHFVKFFTLLYCLCTFGGAMISVELLWSLCNVSNLLMVCINLLGILYLLPLVRRGIQAFVSGKAS